MVGERRGGDKEDGPATQRLEDVVSWTVGLETNTYCSRLSWGSWGRCWSRVSRLSSVRVLQDNL